MKIIHIHVCTTLQMLMADIFYPNSPLYAGPKSKFYERIKYAKGLNEKNDANAHTKIRIGNLKIQICN
jgi:hypothetical protein